MCSTIYQRLYGQLLDLVPGLREPAEGASYCAASVAPGDIALFCDVANVQGRTFDVAIAHDAMIAGQAQPAPWMCLRVDHGQRTAELIALEDRWSYETISAAGAAANPRRAQLNIFALHNVTAMIRNCGAFQPASDILTIA